MAKGHIKNMTTGVGADMSQMHDISLVLADVDGTLVDEDKTLTDRALTAVQGLYDRGIRFAITSGRPPRGMAMLFDALQLDTPVAGYNGGLFVEPDLSILEHKAVPADVAGRAFELLRDHGLDVWVYRGNDWLITEPDAPHVARERQTVQFRPKVVDDVASNLEQITKIVGVSDDHEKIRTCEEAAQAAFGEEATAARSQPYYLDVTHRNANKGSVVEFLSSALDIPARAIATIGDQANDIMMFEKSGFSIAMGNASDQVKSNASVATDLDNDDGFAKAIERFILSSSD